MKVLMKKRLACTTPGKCGKCVLWWGLRSSLCWFPAHVGGDERLLDAAGMLCHTPQRTDRG